MWYIIRVILLTVLTSSNVIHYLNKILFTHWWICIFSNEKGQTGDLRVYLWPGPEINPHLYVIRNKIRKAWFSGQVQKVQGFWIKWEKPSFAKISDMGLCSETLIDFSKQIFKVWFEDLTKTFAEILWKTAAQIVANTYKQKLDFEILII